MALDHPWRGRLAVACVSIAIGFGYGVMVGVWQIFPHDALQASWRWVSGLRNPDQLVTEGVIETSLLSLRSASYPGVQNEPRPGRGGALVVLDAQVLGVDGGGQFFVYRGKGGVLPLEIEIDTNVADLRRQRVSSGELEQAGLDPAALVALGLDLDDPSGYNLRSFRFVDLAARPADDGTHVFASYYYWHPAARCKSLRVARFVAMDMPGVLAGTRTVSSHEWEVIFESSPCLGFNYRNNSPFQSPNSGGRLLLTGDKLLVSVGDHHLDGLSSPVAASQEGESDYGKIIEIDLPTLQARQFVTGLRNPQGLTIDRQGRIWETEHGPRGGDELNLIRDGENYGWPLVTFGTQYGDFDWQLNPAQGRHDGYTMPVYAWVPSIGISNLLEIRRGPARWDGDLLVSSLEANSLFRLRIEDDRVVVSERINVGERVRDLVQMQDGSILLWTASGRLMELTPLSG